jgi:hypothetical protein
MRRKTSAALQIARMCAKGENDDEENQARTA